MNEMQKSSSHLPASNHRPQIGIFIAALICIVAVILKYNVHHRANLAYAQGRANYDISFWLFVVGAVLLSLSFCFWLIDGMLTNKQRTDKNI